jgi:deazaflavin-dependent oxidoreductase (nitroreductase family)
MPLDPDTIARLARTRTIDLTTIGRRSGRLATIEIWWFHFEGRFIVTGTPGPRDWYANVLANRNVMVRARAEEYQGQASVVADRAFRQRFFTDGPTRWYPAQSQLTALVETAPMIQIELSNPDGLA